MAPPLLIQLTAGTHVRSQTPSFTGHPIVGNGPPGTAGVFQSGQIVRDVRRVPDRAAAIPVARRLVGSLPEGLT